MNDTSISAAVSGGAVGVAGAQVVRIENLYVGTAASTELVKPAGPIPLCPYPGLAYFGPEDASRFFGREQAISALVAAVAKRSFTALVGASGSGKSSVVLAGLAPRLSAQRGWRSTYFRIGTEPDKNPFSALARALEPLTGERGLSDKLEEVQKLAQKLAIGSISLTNIIGQCRAANPGKRILLIADQFEEAFTFVPDEALRHRFIDGLMDAFPDPELGATPDVCLVLTLRADFYSAALRHRPLADKLQDRVANLGPMTRDELHDAIVKPAEELEPPVVFEPGLAGTILDDVERRPGSLPLLQFALREMWGHLKAPLMARADYVAIGGVEGALAKRAQAIFEDATKNETDVSTAALFRQLFTRLVTLGEGAEDTRRIVAREELGQQEWALAQKLADEDNRLVVTAATTPGQETVEVAHEALIRNWPALADWVNRDRTFISWRNQFKQRMDDWRKSPGDEGTLLRGGPLAVAEDWIARRGSDLNEEEKTFVAKGLELRDAEKLMAEAELREKQARLKEVFEAQETIAQAQRERAAAQEKTERALRDTAHAQLRNRWALATTATVVVAAVYLFYWQYSSDTIKLRAGQDQLIVAQSVLETRELQLGEAQKHLQTSQKALEANEIALQHQQTAAHELKSSLEAKQLELATKRRELQHQQANLLGELANTQLANGIPDASLRFAAKGAEDDLDLHLGSEVPSTSKAALTAAISREDWRVAFQAGEEGLTTAGFSPDGTLIVTATKGNTARVWDVATEKEIAVLRGHEGEVNSAVFSPDGARIVTASSDKTARVWDVVTAKQIAVLRGHEGEVNSAAFSPDGARIVTASSDKMARVWDVVTAKQIAVMRGHEGVLYSAAFSPDGTRIVTASSDKTARVWDAVKAKQMAVLRGHEGEVTSAAFSSDGARIVTASADRTARVWDTAMAKEVAAMRGHEDLVDYAAFSPDGTRIVTASWDKTARVWDALTAKQIAVLRGHEGQVHYSAFSSDGTRILTASDDKTARIWEVAVLHGHESEVNSAAFSPNETRIVTSSNDKTARVWDAVSAKQLAVLRGHEAEVNSAAFSPDGMRIVTASWDKTARVWDAETAKQLAVLRGHTTEVKSAAFSPDGKRVVTASGDMTARVWDVVTAKQIAILRGHEGEVNSAMFSPDGMRIVTASDDETARVWDAATAKQIAVLRGHEAEVNSAAFSPDGTRIVTASNDNTTRVWDAAEAKELAALRGHEHRVNSATFSPDGLHIVTASDDNTARIWEVRFATMPVEKLLAEVCNRRMIGFSTMTRDEMRLAGYPDSEPLIDVCAGVGDARQ
jgi:WD40 repeat protein/energy-coupling factor transporter ATP-binding protein EcfA2